MSGDNHGTLCIRTLKPSKGDIELTTTQCHTALVARINDAQKINIKQKRNEKKPKTKKQYINVDKSMGV